MTHYNEIHPRVFVHKDITLDWPAYQERVNKPKVLVIRHNPTTGHTRTEQKTLLAAVLDSWSMSKRPRYANYMFYILNP